MEKEQYINKKDLYQSKYNYYNKLMFYVVILSCLAETTYFISDCQLFNRFAIETLIPRFFILIPMYIYIIINKKTNNYKIMVPLSYFILHCAMWCTIWSIYYLPIKTYAREGFIIMHIMFIGAGLCSPFKYSLPFHSFVITNILFSNLFNHYEDLNMMMSLGIPCFLAIEALMFIMDKLYYDHYLMQKELERILYTDQLTKIYNRNIIKKITKQNSNNFIFDEAYLIILDIDFFKKVNDTYGHEKGDEVLISMAKSINKCINEKEYFIRWGGEEFIIISPNSSLEHIKNLAEKIQETIKNDDNGVCKVTLSMGISKYNKGDYHRAVCNADNALYTAKANGRNRFCFFK